jgi:hypothetical protein
MLLDPNLGPFNLKLAQNGTLGMSRLVNRRKPPRLNTSLFWTKVLSFSRLVNSFLIVYFMLVYLMYMYSFCLESFVVFAFVLIRRSTRMGR